MGWLKNLGDRLKSEVTSAVAEGNARADAIVAGDSFEGVYVSDGRVHHKDRSVALAGAQAVIETAGQIERRGGAFVGTGGVGVVLSGKRDWRELYLVVIGTDGEFVVHLDPDKQAKAREFAARINTLAKQAR